MYLELLNRELNLNRTRVEPKSSPIPAILSDESD